MPPEPLSQAQPSSEESALILAARAGDREAFRVLVEAHESRVAATVTGMLGEGPDADDVGQEVFLRLHRALDGFRGEARLSTWITRVAINLSLDRLRARQRWHQRFLGLESEEGRPLEPALDGEALLDERERSRLVRRAVRRLRPTWRAVVVLRHLQGFSTEETAAALGLPYGTVLSRLSRGLAMLRRDLQPLLEGAPAGRRSGNQKETMA
jgi:RNA polymerase sigma-70 factor (ECF subfamily)